MKSLIWIWGIGFLTIFAACDGGGEASQTKVDLQKLEAEQRYAYNICECLGEEKQALADLNKILKELGRDALRNDTTLQQQYEPVGAKMTGCMNQVEKNFAADGVDPNSEEFELKFKAGLKEHCPVMAEFLGYIEVQQ